VRFLLVRRALILGHFELLKKTRNNHSVDSTRR
jgi:hypothetical protein